MADPPAAAPRHWNFRVLLDSRPIGEHDFEVSGEPGSERVQTRAHFSVKAFFVPVYGYVHQDTELWQNGCLVSMVSRTTENGHESQVLGSRSDSGFEVHGARGTSLLPSCIGSFAYWDLARLRAARLLNAQSGEFEPVVLTRQGAENILSQGRRVDCERYLLTAAKFTIQLWYASDGRWLALESHTAEGRTLRYEKQ